jgi:hypothetical protein
MPLALKIILLLNGKGILGPYPNLPNLGYLGVSKLICETMFFE